jgi:hypothetical protein
MLANPYDDNYPEPFVQAYSHTGPDHNDPYSEIPSSAGKRERSPTPPSLNGALQSNGPEEPSGPPSKRRKRVKKKEAQKKARAEVATTRDGPVSPPVSPHCLQVDDPVHVPRGPSHRILPDPSAPPYLQYFHTTQSPYASILCRDAAHWSTTHQDDISVPTSAPSRILFSDLQPPTPSRSKRVRRQLVDPVRKLVVLDLNGSLLWRTSLKTNTGPRKTFRRPYVGVLAQYLAHERTTQTMVAFPNQPGRRAVPLEWHADRDGHFKRGGNGKGKGKDMTILAPLDAMIWSSVQPRNVEDMVDVAFGSLQTVLGAVWTRSMIGLSQAAYRKYFELLGRVGETG